jgi:hypothetical protein
MVWDGALARHERRDQMLKKMEEWKKFVIRASASTVAIITFYFSQLLSRLLCNTEARQVESLLRRTNSARATLEFVISGTV